MPELFVVAVMVLIPNLIFLELAALIVLRVIWWLPDWCLKVVVLVTVARRGMVVCCRGRGTKQQHLGWG